MRSRKTVLVIGIVLFLLLIAGVVGTHDKIEYFYFDVASSEINDTDWQKPDLAIYFGDKVPLKSTVDWNGRDLQVLNVNRCCVPFLEIQSPVALSNIIVTSGKTVSNLGDLASTSCVHIFEKAENTFLLSWIYWPEESGQATCIRIGDEISIEFVPEDGSDPSVLHAVLVRAGHYWLPHFL
jgi:hypothetical protein